MKSLPHQTSLFSFETTLSKAGLSHDHTVADFGSGKSMNFLYALRSALGKKGHIFAIDILPEVIEHIEREIKHHDIEGLTLLQANIEAKNGVPLSEAALDRIFIINTLHQISDTIALFNEAKRLLKETGQIIVVDWALTPSPLGPNSSRRLSAKSVIETALFGGLTLKAQFLPGPYHYGLVFSKNS